MIEIGDQVKMLPFYTEKYSSEWVNKFKDQIAIVLNIKHIELFDKDCNKPITFDELWISFDNDKSHYIVSNFGFEKV